MSEKTIHIHPTTAPAPPRERRGEKRKLRLRLGSDTSEEAANPAAVKYRVVLKCGYENKKEKIVGKAPLLKR